MQKPRRSYTLASGVLEDLRQRILAGHYAPGTRIPPQANLMETYSASSLTIQRAIGQLKAEGLIETHGRSGTRVVDRPPHLHRHFLVFDDAPNGPQWNRYQDALYRSAQFLAQNEGIQFEYVFGPQALSNTERHQQVLAQVNERLIHSIIYAGMPYLFNGSPFECCTGIPRVSLYRMKSHVDYRVVLDWDSFHEQACALLASKGCKQPCILFHAMLGCTPERLIKPHVKYFKRHRMVLHDQWTHAVTPHAAGFLPNLFRLILDNSGSRPDGILITDDNLTSAVMSAACSVDCDWIKQTPIVGHANYPLSDHESSTVHRVGFDTMEVLRHATSVSTSGVSQIEVAARAIASDTAFRKSRQ